MSSWTGTDGDTTSLKADQTPHSQSECPWPTSPQAIGRGCDDGHAFCWWHDSILIRHQLII